VSGRITNLTNPESKMDSFVKQSLAKLLNYMDKNSVWKDAAEQIYINENGKIDLVFLFSEPIIKIGYVDDKFEQKMNKVNAFFKTIVRCHDLASYSELDFQYSQQVVARKKM
jgi:hypothetical protein